MSQRTQVGIVGAGPAGLLLSHLLAREGIESVVLENRSRAYVEGRIRAGVLEQGTVDVLNETGLGERMKTEGLIHNGIELRFSGRAHRIDFPSLTGGKRIAVYGQHEVIRDMVAARLADGGTIRFDVAGTNIHGFDGDRPRIDYNDAGEAIELDCDFIAGCDGFHGICRPSVPPGALTVYERVFPFAWLGILSQSTPPSDEVTYTYHDDGFALLSMRSPTMSRLYLQCVPDEDLANWPDARIWEELRRRTALANGGGDIEQGPILQRGVTPMRAFVAEPMRFGSLFLAGDAAHIVPPTGAKGMNLAVADVRYLTEGLATFYRSGDRALLEAYSDRCLRRVWKAQRFSWWMTTMLHVDPDGTPFDRRRQLAELDYVTSSEAAMRTLAENYVGLPFDEPDSIQ